MSGCVFARGLGGETQGDANTSGHRCWGLLPAPNPTVPGKLSPESHTEPGETVLSAGPHPLFAQL